MTATYSEVLATATILIADDEPAMRGLLADTLGEQGATVIAVSSGRAALEAIEQHPPDLAILDVRMPEPGGLAILQHLRERDTTIPVLIITGFGSSTVAIESTYHGAFDFLTKPFAIDDVLNAITRALEHRRELRATATPARLADDPRDVIIGQSSAMQQVYKLIGRIAHSDATVLITGESGTGKELIARTLHQTSPRADKPLVIVNCAALTETLLESELFGHEKGAFTGAMARRKGRFEEAHQGTIFLDEIGEMSQGMQKKLLRVLQEKTFERVGGNTAVKSDVRVLTATNRDLWAEVIAGRFREDLYYRLNVIALHIPPLRERREDIPVLVTHFLHRATQGRGTPPRITAEAMHALQAHPWTGNVRQLENTIERAVVLAQNDVITPEHLRLDTAPPDLANLSEAVGAMVQQGDTLKTIIAHTRHTAARAAIRHYPENPVAAAATLGIRLHELETLLREPPESQYAPPAEEHTHA